MTTWSKPEKGKQKSPSKVIAWFLRFGSTILILAIVIVFLSRASFSCVPAMPPSGSWPW